MSSRTSKANRAIREAWEKEKELILKGQGSRDWSKKQQQSIIDYGVAYDENNKAFEGHHKKSVEAYPEYQGDADNIQFLSREEHKQAHNGNFQNPTNGYYDYKTRNTKDYGTGVYKPNPIIELSNPIVKLSNNSVSNKTAGKQSNHSQVIKEPSINPVLEAAGNFIKNNKGKIGLAAIGTVATVVVGKKVIDSSLVNYLSDVTKTLFNNNVTNNVVTDVINKTSEESINVLPKVKDVSEDIVEKLYTPNDVPEHTQKYHTLKGIIEKVVPKYHRGD